MVIGKHSKIGIIPGIQDGVLIAPKSFSLKKTCSF